MLDLRKCSNKPLGKILKELTHKIIVPAHLSVPQRKRLFRTRWRHKLQTEPIEIEIDEQRVRLRHIDKSHGAVPPARGMLFQALDNMQTFDDWAKLPLLLEALWYKANTKFLPGDWPRVVRKAGLKENLGSVFEAMKRPERTGLKLDRSETVAEVMISVVLQAANEGWTASATERAFKNAERVMQFLEEEGHQLKGQAKVDFEKTGRFPLKRDPQVLATPVMLAAIMIVKHGKGDEYLKKLRIYLQVVLEKWPADKGLLELHPHEAYIDPEGMQYLMERNKFLTVASPILRGFDLAVEALGRDAMAKQLEPRRDAVREEVRSALAAIEDKTKRGPDMYEKCFAEPQTSKTKGPERKASAQATA